VSVGDASLVDATLARIDRHDREAQEQFRLVGTEGAARWRPRWSDLVTLAAVFLIGFGVLVPVVRRVHDVSAQNACAANLASLGGALNLFARDHGGELPHGARDPWESRRNSENLAALLDGGYCQRGHLNCPGHGGAGPSYAYRMIMGSEDAQIDARPNLALLSDRNPMIDRAIQGEPVTDVVLPSTSHRGNGQQVLFGTLEVRWLLRPVVKGPQGDDNLWLIRVGPGHEDLLHGAWPSPDDNFLSQ
jgi:hypothetical protein